MQEMAEFDTLELVGDMAEATVQGLWREVPPPAPPPGVALAGTGGGGSGSHQRTDLDDPEASPVAEDSE